MISSEEAFLLLNKWREDGHPLKLMVAAEGVRMSFAGRIEKIDGTQLEFFPDIPSSCDGAALIDLVAFDFEYGDSREAPPESQSKPEISSILTAERSDGVLVMFAELRE